MTLAPEALAALRTELGPDAVTTDPELCRSYERATFDTTQRVHAVVFPETTHAVQTLVRLARKLRLALYPVSGGRNWGLGSRVPTHDGSVVVDLRRMNAIVACDEALSYVTVEPGVTFRQLTSFLKEQHPRLYISTIGGPPDASVLGNTLERGDGLGPLGDRWRSSCALEAVLGTGEVVRTGLGVFGREPMTNLAGPGLGPELSGLFSQSNLAIVTRLTLWLARAPEDFQGVAFAIKDPAALGPVLTAMRELQQRDVIKANSFALWNAHKYLASLMQYPFDASGAPLASPEALLDQLPDTLQGVRWVGTSALYSASKLHAYADRRLLRRALAGHVSELTIFGEHPSSKRRRSASKILGLDPELARQFLYRQSPFLGNTTEFSIRSVYWRKRSPRPAEVDPDRDRCGLHWVCTALPFAPEHVSRHSAITERVAFAHGLEPNLSYVNVSERYLKAFAVIAYDRDAEGEETRARSCHDAMLAELAAAGYPAVRLGVQSQTRVRDLDPAHVELLRELKGVFDPEDVIAPGRYDFRHLWDDHTR